MRKHYKNLAVWQLSMDLAVAAYAVARALPAEERFELSAQLRKAAVSVPCNIAEGHGRYSNADFARFLSIASGSAREIEVQVLLAVRLYSIPAELAERALELADHVGRKIARLISAIHRQQGRLPAESVLAL